MGRIGTSKARRRGLTGVVVALVMALTALGLTSEPAGAAGLNLPIQMGQRFLGSASPAKAIPLPLKIEIGPIRPFAVAGINATTFSAIKDPLLGITIFSSSEVKQLTLDTINGLSDDTILAFQVDALTHTDPAEFTLGGNCLGANGTETPACVATVVFKPTTVGLRQDPISADITITRGMEQIEASLKSALDNQGAKGYLINAIYPLVQSTIQKQMTDGIEGAMLKPFATASGVGVAGPFTDPSVFVKRQYADFAGGTPSASTVSGWVKKFEGGTAPSALLESLRKSANYDGRMGPVTRLYSAYFLRIPDLNGLQHWVTKSRGGTRLYAISSTFAASSEFQRRYGSLTDAQFIALVYQNVLGRKPDSGGLAYWKRQLANGGTRGRLMVGFSESSEYVRKQNGAVVTIELYAAMLHRMPTKAELDATAARINGGTTPEALANELLGGAEYRKVLLG